MKIFPTMLLLFCLMWLIDLQAEPVQWLKIDHPSTATRQALQGQGIHYENFIWVAREQINQTQLSHSAAVVHNPFHHRVDNEWLDLKHDDLPANEWFEVPSGQVGEALYVVQFNGPIKTAWLNALSEQQIKLVSPLAPFSWIVWADRSQMNALSRASNVRNWNYLYAGFRVQASNRHLSNLNVPSMALLLTDAVDASMAALNQLGAVVAHRHQINNNLVAINFSLPGDRYLAAAQIPGVLTVQQVSLDGGPRGEMSQQSIVGNYDGSNQVQTGYATWLNNTGLDGSGVVVAVVDGGIYQNHPDLTNVVACTGTGASCADSTDAHGSHVAGAIAGTGAANSLNAAGFNRGLGVAPGAQVVEQLYGPLLGAGPGGMLAGGMLSIFKDSQTSGAMLSNNSWGPTGVPQGYDIPTMEVDISTRDANPDVPGNQPILAVWSIMNGNGDRNTGTCAPSSLGSPDEAKNLFAVGSTKLQNFNATQINDIFDISSNSAHGPACDGRLVPHIVAPGCRTEAPTSATGYGMLCGTSMASPVMSGAIALFWEQYVAAQGVAPSPALVKAVFTSVAQNLVGNDDADGGTLGHAPNREQGWGRVDLDQVINPNAGFLLYDQQTVFTESGQNWQQMIMAIDPAEPIRMMLVWTDAPGAGMGGTNPAWVNDLDLSVAVNSDLYLGNQFGPNAYSTTGGSADGMNNMEAVFLTAAQHQGQAISIEVMASNIAANALNPYSPTNPVMPQQDFALACYNCQPAITGVDLIFADSFDLSNDLIFIDGFE